MPSGFVLASHKTPTMKTNVPNGAMMLFLSIILFSCTKEALTTSPSTDFISPSGVTALNNATDARARGKIYVIEAGKHYADGVRFPRFSGATLSFKAIFDSSAIYNFTDPATKYDQNTLYGFADNNQRHENFSARFGWRWFDNQLQIAAYTINNSIPTIVQIGTVPLGEASDYSIAVNGDHYDFTLNGVTTSMPRASTTATAGYYKLVPYFGGNASAPQTVRIGIKDK